MTACIEDLTDRSELGLRSGVRAPVHALAERQAPAQIPITASFLKTVLWTVKPGIYPRRTAIIVAN
jgi:hypothetical protein